MGRATYAPLDVGLTAAADLNTILSAIETETTNIERVNIEEEGIDRRVLESEVQAARPQAPITMTGAGTQALTTTWATLNPSHAAGSLRTGSITLLANEQLRYVLDVEFVSDSTETGIPAGGDVQLRWRQSVAAVVTTIGTTRRLNAVAASMPASVDGAASRIRHQVVIDGPVALEWVEIQISDQSGNDVTVQNGGGSMHGVIFKRVTV